MKAFAFISELTLTHIDNPSKSPFEKGDFEGSKPSSVS